jgi:hypothetical protein
VVLLDNVQIVQKVQMVQNVLNDLNSWNVLNCRFLLQARARSLSRRFNFGIRVQVDFEFGYDVA